MAHSFHLSYNVTVIYSTVVLLLNDLLFSSLASLNYFICKHTLLLYFAKKIVYYLNSTFHQQ